VTAPDLPEITQDHRRRAFELLAMRGVPNFDAAMSEPWRARVIEARAAALRTQEWQASQQRTQQLVPRVRLGLDGHPIGWCTQVVAGAHAPRKPGLF
jgi:hypothetical protein